MKRLLQISALLVITVLALQPALDGLACSLLMRTACPMGMGAMSADCPMAQQTAQAGCAQDCCNHALPQTAVIKGIPAKPRAGVPALGLAADLESLHLQTASTPRRALITAASSPPRYILNQVFRI